MDAKTSEDSRRTEVERGKEQELADLRSQVSKLQTDLKEARKMSLDIQSKLKVELDNSVRAHGYLQESHKALAEREGVAQARLVKAEGGPPDLQKAKRALESELQSVRSHQIDVDGHLGEAIRIVSRRCVLPLIFLLSFSDNYSRDWSVNSSMHRQNVKTLKTQCYNWNERNQLMSDHWTVPENNLRQSQPSATNSNNSLCVRKLSSSNCEAT